MSHHPFNRCHQPPELWDISYGRPWLFPFLNMFSYHSPAPAILAAPVNLHREMFQRYGHFQNTRAITATLKGNRLQHGALICMQAATCHTTPTEHKSSLILLLTPHPCKKKPTANAFLSVLSNNNKFYASCWIKKKSQLFDKTSVSDPGISLCLSCISRIIKPIVFPQQRIQQVTLTSQWTDADVLKYRLCCDVCRCA